MSCYLRHMKKVLNEAGIDPKDKTERKEVDIAIRRVVGKTSEDKCNIVWREVKKWINDEEKEKKLVKGLKNTNGV
ncbi:MAG: hypothetical protein Q7V10_05910 [Methanobacteriaceae archaeon]|nr:hypothetical protein [Methanobacteriaceae archaeon]MDO9627825.1 hypothetical protein [Methanobacteriaceae archaeon]